MVRFSSKALAHSHHIFERNNSPAVPALVLATLLVLPSAMSARPPDDAPGNDAQGFYDLTSSVTPIVIHDLPGLPVDHIMVNDWERSLAQFVEWLREAHAEFGGEDAVLVRILPGAQEEGRSGDRAAAVAREIGYQKVFTWRMAAREPKDWIQNTEHLFTAVALLGGSLMLTNEQQETASLRHGHVITPVRKDSLQDDIHGRLRPRNDDSEEARPMGSELQIRLSTAGHGQVLVKPGSEEATRLADLLEEFKKQSADEGGAEILTTYIELLRQAPSR